MTLQERIRERGKKTQAADSLCKMLEQSKELSKRLRENNEYTRVSVRNHGVGLEILIAEKFHDEILQILEKNEKNLEERIEELLQ